MATQYLPSPLLSQSLFLFLSLGELPCAPGPFLRQGLMCMPSVSPPVREMDVIVVAVMPPSHKWWVTLIVSLINSTRVCSLCPELSKSQTAEWKVKCYEAGINKSCLLFWMQICSSKTVIAFRVRFCLVSAISSGGCKNVHLTNKRRSPGELPSFADQRRGLRFLGSSADGDILGWRVLGGKEI